MMTYQEVADVGNQICGLDKESPADMQHARDIVAEVASRVPTDLLSADDLELISLFPNHTTYPDLVFQAGAYMGLLSKLGLIKKAQ